MALLNLTQSFLKLPWRWIRRKEMALDKLENLSSDYH